MTIETPQDMADLMRLAVAQVGVCVGQINEKYGLSLPVMKSLSSAQ